MPSGFLCSVEPAPVTQALSGPLPVNFSLRSFRTWDVHEVWHKKGRQTSPALCPSIL